MKNKGLTRRDLLKVTGAGGAMVALGSQPALAAPPKAEELPKVPRKRLGKTKKEIPILLMGGSMKFDPRFDPKFAECMRFGIDYFDMADCYAGGTAEPALGAYLEKAKNRDQVWITTKSDAWDPKGLVETLNQSLSRMKTNRVELLYLHGLDNESALNAETAKTAEQLKKEGKIQFFGFSCHSGNVVELMNKAAGLSWIDSIMFRYNFRQYGNAELNKAIDACAKADIGLIAMKTQGSEASFADAWKKFEQNGKWSKHQAVLKAVWADPRITAAVSHMDTFDKLKQNIAAAVDKKELGALELEALRQYAAVTRSYACDGCDHLCNPAVDAPVQIGATMRYLMYHDVYGDPVEAKRRFAQLPKEAQNLDVDFSRANQACPSGIDVAAHMRRAKEVLTELPIA